MVAHAAANNGRLDFMVLKDHYKGVGVPVVNAVQTDKLMIYSGENKSHIWWDKYQRQLTDAFNTYDHLYKRSVH